MPTFIFLGIFPFLLALPQPWQSMYQGQEWSTHGWLCTVTQWSASGMSWLCNPPGSFYPQAAPTPAVAPQESPSGCISKAQAIGIAERVGFAPYQADEIAAIGIAESGLCPATSPPNIGGSIDRGYLQFNSYWHAEVSNSCAYNAYCAFAAAYRVSGGYDFHQWTTFDTGAYLRYL